MSVSFLLQLHSRLSWVASLFLLATGDVILNWLNLMELSDSSTNYGIVMGPPIFALWILLFVFTILRSIGYILEVLNSFTVFVYDGQTRIAVVHEQLLVISVSIIPLSALNFLICKSRNTYTSTLFTLCGTSSIIYIFLRFVWYAHMEGKRLVKKDDGYKISKGLFMLLCTLYAVSMSFPVMCWRHSSGSKLQTEYIDPVNIYLLKAPFLEYQRLYNYKLNHILELHGRSTQSPYVVQSLTDITEAGELSIIYPCDGGAPQNATMLLPECRNNTAVLFRFVYTSDYNACPYGSISYNYAWLKSEADDLPPEEQCSQALGDFHSGWRLHYFRTIFYAEKSNRLVNISSPWDNAYTTPRPLYDPTIPVCQHVDLTYQTSTNT